LPPKDHPTPLISKVLLAVVLVLIIGIGAFVASIAISLNQEYAFLSSQFSQDFQNGGSIKNVDFHFDYSSNGSVQLSTQFQIPNKMSYPLSVGVNGTMTLGVFKIFSFARQYPTIMPGAVQNFVISLDTNLSSIPNYQSFLSSMYLNAVQMKANLTAYFSIDQFFNFNMLHSSNWTIGPILDQLNASAKTTPELSNNGEDWILPVTLTWNNTTPLNYPTSLAGIVTKMPGSVLTANYVESSSRVNLTQGINRNVLYFYFPFSKYNSLPSGTYSFNLTVGYGTSGAVTIPESVTI
jgi:hypothetical protein